ncbi:MAG TPA: cytochrome b/b6 domain-containing protein [Thermoanaerobaculia bacterium]
MRKLRTFLVFAAALALPAVAAAQATNDDCLACHSDATLTKDVAGKAVSVHVDPEKFGKSIHGVLSCTDCHGDIAEYPHPEKVAKVACQGCHPDAVTAHEESIHGKARAAGIPGAPECGSCHGNAHEILPGSDPASRTAHRNVPATCGSCHGVGFVMEPSGFSVEPYLNYRESVHGRAIAAGDEQAAVCTDCHEYHAIQSPKSSSSPINKFNIPHTCGRCHGAVAAEFTESIHGAALDRGNWLSPSCTDCHGIHNIKTHLDPSSSVSFKAVASTTCAQCHAGVRLTTEMGIAGQRVQSYRESYHGLATRFGSTTAANCASCHGVHNILPSTNPKSLIHPQNLAKTCGSCHPGASDTFVKTKVHMVESGRPDLGNKVIGFIQTFYIWMVVLTIGSMLLHNVMIWIRKVRDERRRPGRVIERMNRNQRIQHMLNLIAFFALVITGFALAFPDSWLSAAMGSNESIRRWIHRGAAILMMGVGIYHVAYMLGTREGRKGLWDFLPRWKDVHDVRDMLLWMIGKREHRPRFARFTYGEKAEYWALIWGTIVMSLTGLVLWAKVWVGSVVDGWWIDVALTIHFWEAVLATLAILVWHLYGVIFDPHVYPMNFAWLDGKMSPEMFEHEHGLEYEKWLAERSKENWHGDEPSRFS